MRNFQWQIMLLCFIWPGLVLLSLSRWEHWICIQTQTVGIGIKSIYVWNNSSEYLLLIINWSCKWGMKINSGLVYNISGPEYTYTLQWCCKPSGLLDHRLLYYLDPSLGFSLTCIALDPVYIFKHVVYGVMSFFQGNSSISVCNSVKIEYWQVTAVYLAW